MKSTCRVKFRSYQKKSSDISTAQKRGEEGMAMTLKRFRVGFHLAVNILNILGAIFALFNIITGERPDLNPGSQHYQFCRHSFTYRNYFMSLWVGALQFLYFSMYSIIDYLEIKCPKNARIAKATDFMHSAASYLLFTIIFPLSTMIFILFWSLFAYNRELIYPKMLDEFIPPLLNHTLHTLPVPLSGVYMLMSNKKEPSRMASLFGLVTFLGFYYYLSLSIYLEDGKWVYIVFNTLTFTQALCALTSIFFASIGFHFLGYKLYESIKHLRRNSDLIRLLNGGLH